MEHQMRALNERHKLSNLPLEILYRVLTVGPCESALALSQVNKRLNCTCSKPFIYIQIIEDKLKYDTIPQASDHIDWHRIAGLHLEKDYFVCAKWALADYRARAAGRDNNIALIMAPVNALKWEPQLLVMSHPERRAMCVRTMADPATTQMRGPEQASQLSFIFAYSMILLDVDSPGRSSNLSAIEPEMQKILETVCEKLKPALDLDAATFLQMPLRRSSEAWKTHIVANLAIGWFFQYLMHARLIGRLDRVGSAWSKQLPSPNLTKIPLASLLAIDAPFSTQPASCWMRNDLGVDPLRTLLTDGEWIGYYCYGYGPMIPKFDSIVSDIRFEVTTEPKANPSVMHLKSRGKDGCGGFNLTGSISLLDGYLTATKQYNFGTSWAWNAVLTKLGLICGTWGDVQDDLGRWGGWFVLWKREWFG